MSRSNWFYVAFFAAGVSVLGCGGGGAGPKTLDVKGTVTLDGAPVAGANVSFAPKDDKAGRTAVGVTDNSGKFTLSTAGGGPGAMPGSYRVAISKTEGGPAPTAPTSQDEAMRAIKEKMASGGAKAMMAKSGPPKDLLPAIYKSPEKSGLTAEVTEGGKNDFTFELKGGGAGGAAGK